MAKKKNNDTQDEDINTTSADDQQTLAAASATTGANAGDADDQEAIDQVEDRFQEYHDQLEEHDIPDAKSARQARTTDLMSAQYQQNYKISFFNEAEGTLDEYSNVKNRISTTLAKDAAVVRGEVDAAVTLYGQLKTALAAATAAIKEAKKKSNAADDAASHALDASNDSTFSEELKAFRKGFGKKNGKEIFDNRLKSITKRAQDARDTADNAVEAAVKVHGIAGFTNVESMKTPGDNMKTGVDGLNTDVGNNITSSQQKKTDAQTELTAALQNTSQADHNLEAAEILMRSLRRTSNYAEEPVDPKPDLSLDDISKKVEKTFLNQN